MDEETDKTYIVFRNLSKITVETQFFLTPRLMFLIIMGN